MLFSEAVYRSITSTVSSTTSSFISLYFILLPDNPLIDAKGISSTCCVITNMTDVQKHKRSLFRKGAAANCQYSLRNESV